MTNEIIEAISTKLGNLFPECRCYREDTIQNLEPPCFIIKLVGAPQRERLGPRVLLDELYSVAFICPGDIGKLREVTELAALHLRFIDLPDGMPIMSHNREATIIDDETSNINFSITRSIWFEPEEEPKQRRLILNMGVKKDE